MGIYMIYIIYIIYNNIIDMYELIYQYQLLNIFINIVDLLLSDSSFPQTVDELY